MDRREKPRPDDCPGANGLRGKKTYSSSRTAVGTWLDRSWGGHAYFERGFTSTNFETEFDRTQTANSNPNQCHRFGSGISDELVATRKITAKDSFASMKEEPNKWISNAKSTEKLSWKGQVS